MMTWATICALSPFLRICVEQAEEYRNILIEAVAENDEGSDGEVPRG
jgi:translation elongation factor 2 (EF-2/EF-G)